MPTSPPKRHPPDPAGRGRPVGALVLSSLVLVGCRSAPATTPSAVVPIAPRSTARPLPATPRELVRQELDATLGAGHYQLLVVVSEGARVASLHRGEDGAGPYEALTTWRLEGRQLTGAAMFRSTQRVGVGPATAEHPGNGVISPAVTRANRELVLTMFHEVIDHRRPDAPALYLTEGYIQHNPIVAPGRAGLEELLRSLGPVPEDRVGRREDLVIADGQLVAVVSSFETGDRRVADLFRVEGARVAEHWDFTAVS